MKNKLLLSIAAVTLLTLGGEALVNVNNEPQVLAAKVHRKHHKKQRQAKKYRPHLLQKRPTYIIGQSTLPDAKSLIKNTGSLPTGTKFSWKKKPQINQPDSYSSGNVKIKVVYPDHSVDIVPVTFKLYGKNEIVIPTNYLLKDVIQADQTNKATKQLEQATTDGMESNKFIAESPSDDKEKVNFYHLTNDQKKRLNNFAVKLINATRTAFGTPSVSTDDEVLSAADKVANRYKNDHYEYYQGHDIEALDRILLDRYGSFAEDMNAQEDKPKTMTDMKEFVYNSIRAYLFNNISWEWHHAASIIGVSEEAPGRLAVSYTRAPDDFYVTHFIFIP